MNTKAKFKITHIANLSGRIVIFVEQLNNCNFDFKPGIYLGDFKAIHFDIPRKVDKNGNQDLNVYGFQIEKESDLSRLSEGDIVNLTEQKND